MLWSFRRAQEELLLVDGACSSSGSYYTNCLDSIFNDRLETVWVVYKAEWHLNQLKLHIAFL